MLNSITAGQRLAQRTFVMQMAIVALTALFYLPKGFAFGGAALMGGAAVALGGWVAARVALGGGVGSAGAALGRLLVGLSLRWLFVALVMIVAIAVMKLPPLPVLIGVIVATVVVVFVNSFQR